MKHGRLRHNRFIQPPGVWWGCLLMADIRGSRRPPITQPQYFPGGENTSLSCLGSEIPNAWQHQQWSILSFLCTHEHSALVRLSLFLESASFPLLLHGLSLTPWPLCIFQQEIFVKSLDMDKTPVLSMASLTVTPCPFSRLSMTVPSCVFPS